MAATVPTTPLDALDAAEEAERRATELGARVHELEAVHRMGSSATGQALRDEHARIAGVVVELKAQIESLQWRCARRGACVTLGGAQGARDHLLLGGRHHRRGGGRGGATVTGAKNARNAIKERRVGPRGPCEGLDSDLHNKRHAH